ncbi:hypothetical protein O0L34_g9911 [Tuta absoluta]|nr:hypothetical protein O0L34_g9911 [Tuta absoluta]
MESVEEVQAENCIIRESADQPNLHTHSAPPTLTKLITDQSIEAALQRGAALRKQKRLIFQPMSTSLHLVSDEDRPTNKHRNNKRCPPRKALSQQKECNSKTCVTFKTGSLPINRTTSTNFVTHRISSKANTAVSTRSGRKPQRCPLRIAELAVPSKRHCIDTWRDRNAMLPAHMLERLKRNVMNQKILATIPDAETCFKMHKNYRVSKVASPIGRCFSPKKSRECQEMSDMRLLCAVFAHRIAAELIKPINVYLPEESMNLVQNVSNEIKGLIQNRRVCADYVYDIELLNEMSGKVTMWISDILACAEYKMLEDELRVVKTQENAISKEGNLVTLIDQYVRWQMEGDQDLEEEEGPALDTLDMLLDNVLEICLPKNMLNDEDLAAKSDQNYLPEVGDESETRNEDLGIAGYETLESEATNEDHDTQVTETANNDSNEAEVYDDTNNHKIDEDDASESEYGSPDDNESNASVDDNIDTEGNNKVSDDDEPIDGRKAVTFLRKGETGGNGESRGNGEAESRGNGGLIRNESLRKWPNYSRSATFIRSDIVFQSPNNSILSAVDESWPDDNVLTLRPSASVLKSVASLGDIRESEDDESDPNESKNGEALIDMKFLEGNEERASALTSSGTPSKMQKNNEDYTTTNTQRTHTRELNIRLSATPSKLLNELHKLVTEEAKNNKDDDNFSDGKGDRNVIQKEYQDDDTTDAEKNLIKQAIKRKLKPEAKFDYRVCPETAPAWAILTPSEESSQITRKKMRLGSSELRKWCLELENTLTHLTHWNRWLNAICRDVEYMQRETEKSKKLGPRYVRNILKEWSGFKKNIDKDAIFWRKLRQKTVKALNKYPTRSQIGSTQQVVRCNCLTIPQNKNWLCTRKVPKHQNK